MSNYAQSGYLVSKPMHIYLAGPCFTAAELAFNVMLATELRAYGHTVELPQDFVNHELDIRQQCLDHMRGCDVMVAVLDGADVDSGTAYEMGWWQGLGGEVIGYRSDLRKNADSAEYGVNAMCTKLEYFCQTVGGIISAIDKLQERRSAGKPAT